MKNPYSDTKLSKDGKRKVKELRQLRSRARRFIRSGNPVKREPAKKVERKLALLIDQVYREEAGL